MTKIIQFIVVRDVLEPTLRQNLYFLHQCKYYLLMYSERCINTSNNNEFKLIQPRIVTCVIILIVSDVTINVLRKFKHLIRMAE